MDGLTQLLLAKYAPDKLQEPVVITKAEAEPCGDLQSKAPQRLYRKFQGWLLS